MAAATIRGEAGPVWATHWFHGRCSSRHNRRRGPARSRVRRGGEPSVRSKRDDLAGDLEAEHIGHAGRREIAALPLMDVGPIDACGFDSTRTSPSEGTGHERSRISSASGPPGRGATIARILSVGSATGAPSFRPYCFTSRPISSIADRGGRGSILWRRGAKCRKRFRPGPESSEIGVAAGLHDVGQQRVVEAKGASDGNVSKSQLGANPSRPGQFRVQGAQTRRQLTHDSIDPWLVLLFGRAQHALIVPLHCFLHHRQRKPCARRAARRSGGG